MLRGDRLRELREERGLSREELTTQLGFSANQVYRYEAGINDATGKMLVKLARFFGVSADYLLGLSDDRLPRPQHVLNIDLSDQWEQIQQNFIKSLLTDAIMEAVKSGDSAELLEAIKELKLPDSPDSPDS